MRNGAPVVLVHGAWHGSWCWSLVVEELATRGIASVAVDLDGHGLKSRSPVSRWRRPFLADAYASEPSPVGSVTATDSAATLVRQLEKNRSRRTLRARRAQHGRRGRHPCRREIPSADQCGRLCERLRTYPGAAGRRVRVLAGNEGSLAIAQFIGDPAMVGAVRLDTGDPSRRHRFPGKSARTVTTARFGSMGQRVIQRGTTCLPRLPRPRSRCSGRTLSHTPTYCAQPTSSCGPGCSGA